MRSFLSANRYRQAHLPAFWGSLACCVLAAFFSVGVLRLLADTVDTLPAELLEPLKVGGQYRFGVLSVADLSELRVLTLDAILSAAFRGQTLTAVCAAALSLSVCGLFPNGTAALLVGRGHRRVAVFAAGVIGAAEQSLWLLLAFSGGAAAGAVVFYGPSALCGGRALLPCVLLLVRMIPVYASFAVLCAAAAFTIQNGAGCVLTMLSGVVALPLALSVIDTVAGADGRLAGLWMVNRIPLLSAAGASVRTVCAGLAVSLVTAIVSFAGAAALFEQADLR